MNLDFGSPLDAVGFTAFWVAVVAAGRILADYILYKIVKSKTKKQQTDLLREMQDS